VKPRLLDLFCGAGGAAMGYHRAGFDVVGVDIRPQPNYPFEFERDDALALLGQLIAGSCVCPLPDSTRTYFLQDFDAIHASPPCQKWAEGAAWHGNEYPDLLTPARELLNSTGLPYVIENVPEAPLRRDVVLCGTQFGLEADGFEIRRHRAFELNWPFDSLVPPCVHSKPSLPIFGHNPNGDFYKRHGRGVGIDAKREAMEMPWVDRDELREAIPPAFTEFIGHQLLAQLRVAA
jgi:DNA (cytosine-5)-methyltransferase 1